MARLNQATWEADENYDDGAASMAASLLFEQARKNKEAEEAELREAMTQRLLEFANTLSPLGPGSVISFDKVFQPSGRLYRYAAIHTDYGWSMTGKRTQIYNNMTFVSLLIGYGLHASDIEVLKKVDHPIEVKPAPIFELETITEADDL